MKGTRMSNLSSIKAASFYGCVGGEELSCCVYRRLVALSWVCRQVYLLEENKVQEQVCVFSLHLEVLNWR